MPALAKEHQGVYARLRGLWVESGFPSEMRQRKNARAASVSSNCETALDDTSLKCERVALASYDAGIEALEPGMTFADLVAVMEEPLKSAGCWGTTPFVHALGPHFLAGRTAVNQEQAKLDVRFAGPNAVRVRVPKAATSSAEWRGLRPRQFHLAGG
jgi:hypothetical protein